jgi:hypothetical protein
LTDSWALWVCGAAKNGQIVMQMIGFGLLLLAWLNPLHLPPWVSWHSEVLAFASGMLMFMGVLLILVRQRCAVLRVPRSALLLVFIAAMAAAQCAFGQIIFFGDALVLGFYLFLVFATLVAGYASATGPAPIGGVKTVADGGGELNQLAWTVLTGALFSTAVALIQSTDVWRESEWIAQASNVRRSGGNISQVNQLATLQIMGLASMALLVGKGKLKGLVALLMYLVLAVGVGLTESRSGLLSAVALFCWWFLHRKNVSTAITSLHPILGLLLMLFSFSFFPLGITFLQEGGFGAAPLQFANVSAGTRLVIWPQLLEASLQQPWLGWGLRQVSVAHNAVLHNHLLGEAFIYSHNIVLDLVLGMGYPITVLIMILCAIWLLRRMRLVGDINSWYCFALVLPVAVHSQLEFPFAYAYFLVPVAFAVGVLEGRLAPKSYFQVRVRSMVVMSGALLTLILWSGLEYLAVEEDYGVARFEALRIGKTPETYERPAIVLLTQMDAVLAVIRLVPSPGMRPENIELARKVALRFPWPATQSRYALSLALNGYPDEAVRQLKVMRAMHGERLFAGTRSAWAEMAQAKYPQLSKVELP